MGIKQSARRKPGRKSYCNSVPTTDAGQPEKARSQPGQGDPVKIGASAEIRFG
jgi:hypothetical protein